jgi:glutaredoxin
MSETIHLKKFMGGQMTPNEAHRKLAFGGHRCDSGGCGQPAAIRIRVFAPADEVMQRSPEFLIQLAAKNEGQIPVVDFRQGKYIRISEVYACDHCKGDAERAAAKGPSWTCVEIDRGIPDKVQVQVQA